MPKESTSVRAVGRLLLAIGVVAFFVPVATATFILGPNQIDTSLDRVLSAAIARQQDLWVMFQVGMGVLASVGGLVLIGAGCFLLRLDRASMSPVEKPAFDRRPSFRPDTRTHETS